jgi:nucleoside-triphosphatase
MEIERASSSVPTGSAKHVLLLTGRPGVGKTTVIRKVIAQLDGLRLAGFYTEEIRDTAGRRTGFRAVTIEDRERTIADVRLASPHRVGKYAVDVAALDELVESQLQLRNDVNLYLIDEIGKMECLSIRFLRAVTRLLDSPKPILATVGARGTGLITDVKRRADAELWEVTTGNREELPHRIVAWLRKYGSL